MLFTPLALVVGLWLLGPAVLGFVASFTNYAPGNKTIQFRGLSNYAAVFGDKQFLIAVTNITFFMLIAVPLELGIGFGLAYLLRRPFRGRGLWRAILLMPWLVSPIANGVMWHFLLGGSTGMINFGLAWLSLPSQPSPLGQSGHAMWATIAVEVWRNAPLVSFLLFPGLLAIPAEHWEQATLDGIPPMSQIFKIALPALRPLLLAVTLLMIGTALGAFDSVLIMTGGGPGSETITPALYSYQQAFQVNNWPIGATTAWFIVAAVIGVGAVYFALARREAL
jgi:multiple sugar transport system permease protein